MCLRTATTSGLCRWRRRSRKTMRSPPWRRMPMRYRCSRDKLMRHACVCRAVPHLPCVHVKWCVCVCVCVVCVCVCVCVCVWLKVGVKVQVHVSRRRQRVCMRLRDTHTYTNTHAYANTHAGACMHTIAAGVTAGEEGQVVLLLGAKAHARSAGASGSP